MYYVTVLALEKKINLKKNNYLKVVIGYFKYLPV